VIGIYETEARSQKKNLLFPLLLLGRLLWLLLRLAIP
jgi:hypothetical protein